MEDGGILKSDSWSVIWKCQLWGAAIGFCGTGGYMLIATAVSDHKVIDRWTAVAIWLTKPFYWFLRSFHFENLVTGRGAFLPYLACSVFNGLILFILGAGIGYALTMLQPRGRE
jgi:hypothetical protein